jgi:hypothetical protein
MERASGLETIAETGHVTCSRGDRRNNQGDPMLALLYLALGLVLFAGLYALTLVLDRT